MWLIGPYPLFFFLHQMWFIIWVLLIVLCKIDSNSTHSYSLLEVQNQKLKPKISSNAFLKNSLTFKWMKKKNQKIHDYHGLKRQNINIYQILIIFICSPMPFLAHWIANALIRIYILHIVKEGSSFPWLRTDSGYGK